MSNLFNIALTGMNAQSDKMAIIGNNISNSSTTGYKSSDITFNEEFVTQEGQVVNGVQNQYGNGVSTGGVTSDWSDGSLESTGNSANIAISGGEGFLVVSYEEQEYYTRAGDFTLVNNPDLDTGGFVLMRPNGAVLMGGESVDTEGNVLTPNGLNEVTFINMVTGETAAPDSFSISASGLVTAEPGMTWESVPAGYEAIKNQYDYQEWLTDYRSQQELEIGKVDYYLPGYTGVSSWRAPEETEQVNASASAGLTSIGQTQFTGEVSADGIVTVGFDVDGNFYVKDNDGAQTDITASLTDQELIAAYSTWEETYNVNGGEYSPGIVVSWPGDATADVQSTASGGALVGITGGSTWEYPEDLYTGASGGDGLVVDIEKFHAWTIDYQATNGADAYIPGVYEGTDGLYYLRDWDPGRDYSFPMEVPEATTYTIDDAASPFNGISVEPSYNPPTESNSSGATVRTYDAAGDYLGTQPEDSETQLLLGYTDATNENLEVNTFETRNWDPEGDYELANDEDTTNNPQGIVGIENYVPPTIDNLVAGIEVLNGQIPLVRFNNPDSLQMDAAGMFSPTSATSYATGYSEPSKNGTGELSQGQLETSNVDLTTEFTDMIQAQRAFEAAGKVITTADEMLQTVMNLKR